MKPPRRPARNPTGNPRTNIKYSDDEMAFILYMRCDKKLNWDQILAEFKRFFPKTTRTKSGLQGCFYRQNLTFPLLDEAGNLVFKDDGYTVETFTFKVREQNESNATVGLCYRDPVTAVSKPWVDEADKMRIYKRGRFD
jgi:hypothetical protein